MNDEERKREQAQHQRFAGTCLFLSAAGSLGASWLTWDWVGLAWSGVIVAFLLGVSHVLEMRALDRDRRPRG